jgi:hypothetical protein
LGSPWPTGSEIALEGIFRRNEITPNTAAAEIEEINSRIQSVSASIDSLNSALEALGIGAEDLAPGEFEVGFLIPREAVDNELEQLGKEFEELDAILGPFMELTGQGRPDIQVRSISGSGFQLFLAALPDRALTMSKSSRVFCRATSGSSASARRLPVWKMRRFRTNSSSA